MNPLTEGTDAHRIFTDWIVKVRPPVVKWCRQSFNPGQMEWTQALGCKNVGRWVEGDIDEPGRVLDELLRFAAQLDFVEFANEESQGKDNPREWDRLMGKCLAFMRDLDERNRMAGRNGPKACIANCSVGQPEVERWGRPSTVEVAEYAAANGHVWGLHEYYKPRPWAGLLTAGSPGTDAERAYWWAPPPVVGWLMMRCTQAASILRGLGVSGFRFIVTESGRDNIPGQPGEGGGFRDVMPGEPYAESMVSYGRQLSSLSECVGWVDFGFNAWEGWKQFDLTEEPAEAERMIDFLQQLPRGGDVLPPKPPNGGGNMSDEELLTVEAQDEQVIEFNPTAALQKAAVERGLAGPSPNSNEWLSGAGKYAGRQAQRFEWADGRVEVALWDPASGTVEWVEITELIQADG